ncbi:hypothetical protein Hanom_Chr12g01121231 [Helianthus anomalus]
MNNVWDAVWVANIDLSFKGSYSFRLTSPINAVAVAINLSLWIFYLAKLISQM